MEKKWFYTDGSTARVAEPLRPQEHIQVRPRVVPKTSAPKKMNLPYVMTLLMVTLLFAYLCYEYLNLQDSINASSKHIAEMEIQLYDLKNDNTVLENRLSAQLELDEVYRIATEELGMVYPDGNATVLYKTSLREYVRQYEDIPEN